MADARCPKDMQYGPCGGVHADGRCEVGTGPCVFLGGPVVTWQGELGAASVPGGDGEVGPGLLPPGPGSAGAARMRELLARRPVVVADFPARALDAGSLAECAQILVGRVDAVLLGDSPAARVQFPPSYRAHLVQSHGLNVWAGLTCRDRNRVAIEGELAALAQVGVVGVHCVTGDHPGTGSRPDARPVFDLDSTRTAHLARSAGHLVSVAEAPLSPPTEDRPARLREKVRAGAEVCFVNHAGGVRPVRSFIEQVRELGASCGFLPCVPAVFDHASARLLGSFPGLVLPDGYLDDLLASRDPLEAGIAAAVELGRGFLELDGVVGINLSGGPGPGREAWFAQALAKVSDGLGISRAAE